MRLGIQSVQCTVLHRLSVKVHFENCLYFILFAKINLSESPSKRLFQNVADVQSAKRSAVCYMNGILCKFAKVLFLISDQ